MYVTLKNSGISYVGVVCLALSILNHGPRPPEGLEQRTVEGVTEFVIFPHLNHV